ncbi:uncharacterized protein [Blastocystis hominis]|uniref:Uncharacterized protein n=1 Tax=Blastocystis hominis TaxID=12968 RepID=D8MAN8_BLAHO|nr:uncharacterized protein [Blastocystis hominis]CBK25127.2 unnamed protein product [Blastocystis hominis]|eukprot:XP_012899175.1 uncharacterized protein [Blastocystis hominis]
MSILQADESVNKRESSLATDGETELGSEAKRVNVATKSF